MTPKIPKAGIVENLLRKSKRTRPAAKMLQARRLTQAINSRIMRASSDSIQAELVGIANLKKGREMGDPGLLVLSKSDRANAATARQTSVSLRNRKMRIDSIVTKQKRKAVRAVRTTGLGKVIRANALKSRLNNSADVLDKEALKKARQGDPHLSRLIEMNASEIKSAEANELRAAKNKLDAEAQNLRSSAARLRARANRVGNGGYWPKKAK